MSFYLYVELGFIILQLLISFLLLYFLLKKLKPAPSSEAADKPPLALDEHTGLVPPEVFKLVMNYVMDNPNMGAKMVVLHIELAELQGLLGLLPAEEKGLLLREVALRIKTGVRSNDLVALCPDHSFLLLLSRVANPKDIEPVIQRILGSFDRALTVAGRKFSFTPSLGASVYPDNGKNADVLLNCANSARRYAADLGGMNYVFFADEGKKLIPQSDILVKDLKTALLDNQFELYYQPQVSLLDGTFSGMEALVRWNHPTKGLVSPAEFIPIAESSGLIVQLGYWVLREACRQHKAWGWQDTVISVNLSGYQFRQKDLVAEVQRILQEEQMDPTCLNLEITESTSMSDINFTLSVLQQFRAMGVLISIDDFGTGHSSLSYLKQFPITTLKIDRSFVNDITHNHNGEVVIKTIIDLAKNLELRVVAEGVETREQLEFLQALSCDRIQGFLISKPVPAEQFREHLSAGKFTLSALG